MTTYNTAGAARMIAERRERARRGVASPRVAALYGLEVLADDVQAGDENRTRFAVLARRAPAGRRSRRDRPGAPRKTTLVFAVRNVPGLAPPLPRRVRRRAASTCRGSSRGRPGRPAGSTSSGSTSTPTPTSPNCAAALDDLRAEAADGPGPRLLPARPRGLTFPLRVTNGCGRGTYGRL